MSTLDTDRPLDSALRSLAQQTLRRCTGHLREENTDTPGTRPSEVHQVRKGIKLLRAWLRLVRPSLGEHYALLDLLLGDAAKALSAARDAQVCRQTLLRLRRQRLLDAPTYAHLRKALPQNATPAAEAVIAARRRLQVAALYVDSAALPESPAVLLKRWKRQLARCERLGKRLNRHLDRPRHADAHALHRWRRQLKYLLNQSLLLAPLHPAAATLEAPLKRLGEQLGEHHDLHVLTEHLTTACTIGNRTDSDPADPSLTQLHEAVGPLMEQLAREALTAAHVLFAND